MRLFKINDHDGSILLEKSEEVLFPMEREDTSKINELIGFMLKVNPKAQGISAIQVGWKKRIAIIKLGRSNPFVIINPVISDKFGVQISTESCLSTDKSDEYHDYYKVKRPLRAKILYYDINGGLHEVTAYKKEVRVFCHEIDHMDGITIDQIGKYYTSEKKQMR